MLFIRSEQEQMLAEQARARFEDRICAHLRRVWRAETDAVTEDDLRQAVGDGMQRAGGYGFTTEFDMARFIDLMFTWTPDFDQNPRTPWAADILADESTGPTLRMDRLYARTERELALLDGGTGA